MNAQRRRVLLMMMLLLSVFTSPGVRAFDEGGQPSPVSAPDPNDNTCVEPGWPNYYYRLPVIFQDISEVGTLQFVAFGYADACKDTAHGKGSRGDTHANIMVYPGVWQPNILQRMADLGRTAKPPTEALPGTTYPGDNAYGWQLPAMPVDFPQLYNDQAAKACGTDAGQLVCPGVPPEFGNVLAAAGFAPRDSGDGTIRYLLEADIEKGGAKATKAWFGTAVADPFYGRFWPDDLKNDHGAGGVLRIILHPVDLTCKSIPATTPVASDGTAQLQPTIGVEGSRAVPAKVGWRVQGEEAWRPGPTVQPDQFSGGAATVSVSASGVQAGQVVQVMINYDRAVNEVSGAQAADVYKNNVCQTTLVAAQPTLELHDIWYSPAPPKPGDRVKLSVALTNKGGAATDTSVTWSVDGIELGADQTPVAVPGLAAGDDKRIAMPGSFPAPKAPSVRVQACITGTDNCVARDVLIQLPPKVALQAPSTWPCQGGNKYWVTWTVKNSGGAPLGPVQRVVRLRTGKSGEQLLKQDTLTLDPGESRTEGVQVPVLSKDQDVQLVTVTLSPDASDTAATAVSCNPPAGAAQGGSITVIVPDDCDVNPDLTSGRPCLNYALTIPGWADH